MKHKNRKFISRFKVIDLFVAFVLLAALIVFLLYYSRKQVWIYVNAISDVQEYSYTPNPPFYWVSNSIVQGDYSYDASGKKIAEVIAVDNVEGDGIHRYLRVKLKVKALYDRRTKQYRINDLPVQIGKPINLDIGQTSFQGIVSYINEQAQAVTEEAKYYRVKLQVRSIEPLLADTYDSGFITTNSSDELIFKIEKSTISPAEKSAYTDDGRIELAYDPIMKDVLIEAVMRTSCHGSVCYFNEVYPLLVGQGIYINGPKRMIQDAKIVQIIEEVVDAK